MIHAQAIQAIRNMYVINRIAYTQIHICGSQNYILLHWKFVISKYRLPITMIRRVCV